MLAEIEQEIIDRLELNGFTTKVFERLVDRTGRAQLIPTVFVSIEEGEDTRLSKDHFKQKLAIFLIITFKALKKEKLRREGIYPVLEGIRDLLTMQRLELDIQPLVPTGFQNITGEESAMRGEIIFQMKFTSEYSFSKKDETSAAALLKIGIDFFHPEDEATIIVQGEADLT